jgi:hypothetical protein
MSGIVALVEPSAEPAKARRRDLAVRGHKTILKTAHGFANRFVKPSY